MEIKGYEPQNPPVHIEPVTMQEGKVLVGGMPQDLQGGVDLPASLATAVTTWLQKPGRSVYYLKWKGSKIPRDAEIGGKEIENASNGVIAADPWGDELIGKYTRIERETKDNPKQHEMLVYVPAPEEEIEI